MNPMKEQTICFYVALFSSASNAMVQLSHKYIPLSNFTSQPYAGTRKEKGEENEKFYTKESTFKHYTRSPFHL